MHLDSSRKVLTIHCSTLYQSVMGGLGSLSAMGVDHNTARIRHRMVYGGLVSG